MIKITTLLNLYIFAYVFQTRYQFTFSKGVQIYRSNMLHDFKNTAADDSSVWVCFDLGPKLFKLIFK